jgi:glycosyltransferase involved in cell wall biosynthesis
MSTTLRMLHLIHTPRHSGAEILVADVATRHARLGHTVSVASLEPADGSFEFTSVQLASHGVSLHAPPGSLSKLQRIAHLRKAMRTIEPDVVFAHSILPSLYGRLSLPFGGKTPKFVTVLHCARNDDFSDDILLQLLEHGLRRRADCVVSVSEGGARSYRTRFGTYPPTHTIKNGIDLNRFRSTDRVWARKKYGLSDDTKLLLQVGRLSPMKQQAASIELLSTLIGGGHRNVQLWFAGLTEDPDYEKQLRNMISRRSLESHVHFLGSRTDVADLLTAADLFLMPSVTEAQSVALLEALASNVLILASDIESFQFAKDMKGVSLAPIQSPKFFEEAKRLLALEERPYRSLDGFNIERTCDDYLAIARRLHMGRKTATESGEIDVLAR